MHHRHARHIPHIKRSKLAPSIIGAMLVTLQTAEVVQAGTTSWTNGTGNSMWSDASNWSNGVPDANTDAVITASASINLGGLSQTALSVTASFGPYTISNGTLTTGHVNRMQLAPNAVLNTASTILVASGTFFDGVIGGGPNPNFDLFVSAGTLNAVNTLQGRFMPFGSACHLNGMGALPNSSGVELNWGTVQLHNETTAFQDRINDAAPINFRILGRLTLFGNVTQSVTERTGPWRLLGNGDSGVSFSPASGAQPNVVNAVSAPSLQREPGATMGFTSLLKVAFDTPPAFVGSQAISGDSRGIIPYLTTAGTIDLLTTLVTYDRGADPTDPSDDIGLRPVDRNTECASTFGATGFQNVFIRAPKVLSVPTACNALLFDNNRLNVVTLNNTTLTIHSGALFSMSTGTSTNSSMINGTGTLVFANEAIIHGSSPRSIDVPLIAPRLTKVSGTLRVTKPTHISGPMVFNSSVFVSAAQGVLSGSSLALTHGQLQISGESQTYDGPVTFAAGIRTQQGQTSVSPSGITVDPGLSLRLNGPVSGVGGWNLMGDVIFGGDAYPDAASGGFFNVYGNLDIEGIVHAQSPDDVQVRFGDPTGPDPILSGNGTLEGHVEMEFHSARIQPGFNGPGRLTIGSIEARQMALELELGGSIPIVNYDQLALLQTTDLTGADLAVQLIGGFRPAGGQQFLVLDNRSGDPFISAFDNMPEGGSFTVGSGLSALQFRITYLGGDGNDVVVTVVPEPGLALLSLGAMMGLWRRRNRAR